MHSLTRTYIPQPHRTITTTAGKEFTVARKYDRIDIRGMFRKRSLGLARPGIPQSDRLISATAGQHPPVRRKGQGHYRTLVPTERCNSRLRVLLSAIENKNT